MLRGGLRRAPLRVILSVHPSLPNPTTDHPMPELFGHTRARVGARHALITPDNHVSSSLPGVAGATAVVLVSPAMGANVAQILLSFQRGGSAAFAPSGTETFRDVMGGGATVAWGKRRRSEEHTSELQSP